MTRPEKAQSLIVSEYAVPDATLPGGPLLYFRKFAAALALILAIAWFALPRFINLPSPPPPPSAVGSELYDPRLSYIDSLDAADRALPSFVKHTGQPQKDLADGIQRMLVVRFAHGFSRFSPRENWIANAYGRLIEELGSSDDGNSTLPVIDSPVRPDDILKHRRAMCSQQMIVFQALLARHGIDYARVSFMKVPSHDAVAARVDGVWRYYDSDWEPILSGVPLADVLQGDILRPMYPFKIDGLPLGNHFRNLAREHQIRVADLNKYPASKGALLQQFTGLLSRWGWILPLLAAFLFYRASGRDGADAVRSATEDSSASQRSVTASSEY